MSVLARACAVLLVLGTASGCAATYYEPGLTARSEITLRYRPYLGLEMWAGRERIASAIGGYAGLFEHVRCVPKAAGHARRARRHGVLAGVFTAGSVVVAVGGIVHSTYGLLSAHDEDPLLQHMYGIYGAVSLTLMMLSNGYFEPHARGHAVDAMNFYNDEMGSLGRSCSEVAPTR